MSNVGNTFTPVHIRMDNREKASGVPDHLLGLQNITVTFEELSVGDYCVDGQRIVERKTLSDFAESIMDGRLFTQASRLAERVELVVFLQEVGSLCSSLLVQDPTALENAVILRC